MSSTAPTAPMPASQSPEYAQKDRFIPASSPSASLFKPELAVAEAMNRHPEHYQPKECSLGIWTFLKRDAAPEALRQGEVLILIHNQVRNGADYFQNRVTRQHLFPAYATLKGEPIRWNHHVLLSLNGVYDFDYRGKPGEAWAEYGHTMFRDSIGLIDAIRMPAHYYVEKYPMHDYNPKGFIQDAFLRRLERMPLTDYLAIRSRSRSLPGSTLETRAEVHSRWEKAKSDRKAALNEIIPRSNRFRTANQRPSQPQTSLAGLGPRRFGR